MSTSYHAAILDHLAEFMLYLSTASSFWFSLNSAHGRSISLSDRLGMFRLQPEEYEALLIVSGLATRFGFKVKPTAWKKFLGGHRLAGDDCVIEFEQKTIDLDAYINGTPPSGGGGVTSGDAITSRTRGGGGGGGGADGGEDEGGGDGEGKGGNGKWQ